MRGGENDPLVGRTLHGCYRVEQRIGQGGMGVVYRAVHVALGAPVAVKVIRRALLSSPTAVERLRREARAASRLRHPNIVAVTDFGDEDGTVFMVMEYVAGKSLSRVISEEAPLPVARAVRIGAQVLSALGEAHACGVLHRDVKPENVLLESRRDAADAVKVLDFGIARDLLATTASERLTQAGLVCGTPGYMSPEQARGEPLDARSDLYSAGVLLYEMLAGVPPAVAPTRAGALRVALGSSRAAPLEALVLRALSDDPRDRPDSADGMREALLACARDDASDDAPGATEVLPTAAQPGAIRRDPLDAADVERVERRASAVLGPIAHYLVRKGSARATSEAELCEAVAGFIASEEDRTQFLAATRADTAEGGASTPRPDAPGGRDRVRWDPAMLERAAAELAKYVGPVARAVVQRACDTATTTEELYQQISLEIPSPRDRDAFRRSAFAARKGMGR